jgi:glycosyltransferase involved in cell wall biosynthesis
MKNIYKFDRVLIVRQGYYPEDARVFKEVSALKNTNFFVHILCLRGPGEKIIEGGHRIKVFRVPLNKKRKGIGQYLFQYIAFFLIAMILTTIFQILYRYRYLQVNTLPDFLVFSTIFAKKFGAKIGIDFHEPTPELYYTKFKKYDFYYRLAILCEQLAIRYSHIAFTVTESLKRRYVERGADERKIMVVPNVPDPDFICFPKKDIACRSNREFNLVIHGTIEERYGHQLIIDAANEIKTQLSEFKIHIFGRGSFESHLKKSVNKNRLENNFIFHGFVSRDKLIWKIVMADAGINSMYKTPYSELIDTNKMYEYILLQVPVISSNLKPILERFDTNSMIFFEAGNHKDLADKILKLYQNKYNKEILVKNALSKCDKIRWDISKEYYLKKIFNEIGFKKYEKSNR